MRRRLAVFLIALGIGALPRPAFADVTAFLGINPTPSTHMLRGFAGGVTLLILGFEVEYADAREDVDTDVPALRTGSFNLLVQTPFPVAGMQFYGTAGGGLYRERLATRQETHVAANVGGGVKISLTGPLRLRIDYRVFSLRGNPILPRPQRVYAGLNLAF